MNFDDSEAQNTTSRRNHEALHAITEHWTSDLAFYKDEVHFLNDLIDKYIGLMFLEEHEERLRKMTSAFSEIDKHLQSLLKRTSEHLKQLKSLLLNPFSHEEHEVLEEHRQLEEYLAAFVKSFRDLKKEIFDITKNVLREEKLKKYLKD